ncbi:MAG: hypothetical protein ACREIS_10155 [Nitrospiraceae bacterium]
MKRRLKAGTLRSIARIFDGLDYAALGTIYCDKGGETFWRDRRGPCKQLGIRLAEVLRGRLRPNGRSLYVGAGVAEIPVLVMETIELGRSVAAYNLRAEEVSVLNAALTGLSLKFTSGHAQSAGGSFDHLWIASVLNDPERFPQVSALSYGRANPVTFDPTTFARERRAVIRLAASCLKKLSRPGLVTTSVEEIPWITDWCARRGVGCVVEPENYPTAIVGDPICYIRVGKGRGNTR